jgi:Zn-dependent M16 (insulinase) family peptidase
MKAKRLLVLCILPLLVLLLSTACGKGGKETTFEVGKLYHGFKFVKQKTLKEYNALGLLFEHEKSGARLLKVVTEDDNKTFVISFRTPPLSDSGTPHIIEHSVLNGSKHFPVKSPFDVLSKGSLKTFLNAMTSSDYTTYPVSSRNNKDYFNLMHVYLDAVFFPRIYDDPKILQQEGWHYELDKKDGEVKYKGVVYNEMKGAFSSPQRELGYVVDKNLFPDTCYGMSSGGYPSAIPKLTPENFKAFHKRYYHPANSYIIVYGDYDVNKELAFIDREYLSKFERIKPDSDIKLQAPFKVMREVLADYPLAKDGKTADSTYLNLSFVTGLGTNRKLSWAMDSLAQALVGLPHAPVRKALMDAGIGKEYRCYHDDTKQSVFTLTVEKANPQDKDRFKQVVFETLEKVAREGVDRNVIKGLINRMEFSLREPRSGFQGLMLAFSALRGWMYADDAFLTAEYKTEIEELKKSLDTKYLETLITEKLVNNPHCLLTVLKPKPGLMEENIAKEKAKLAEYKKTLSDEQLEELVKNTKALKEYQNRPDTKEALDTIPLLKLEDIEKRADYFEITEKKIKDVKYLTYPTFSKDIVYNDLLFDMSVVPQDLLPYASLLSNVLKKLNTKNYTYGDLDTEVNLHTGGINFYVTTYYQDLDLEKPLNKFVLGGKTMNHKIKEYIGLCKEILVDSKFDDPKRLKEVLNRHQANQEARIQWNGLGVALTRLASYYSLSGQFEEIIRGISYYKFVTDLTRNYDEKSAEIIAKLKKVASLLFNRAKLHVAVTAAQKDVDAFGKEFMVLYDALGDKEVKPVEYKFTFDNKNEGITSPSKVQYVVQGFNYKKLGYKFSGKMRVLNQILSREYLHKKVRVMGGAYGGFAGISSTGLTYFGSYRDPNLQKTLENYKNAPQFLKDFKVDEKDMRRFIIGTMARYEFPYTAQRKGDSALSNYFQGETKEMKLKNKEEILSTTQEDIRGMAKMISDILAKEYYCVYGNKKKLEDAKDLFTKFIKSKE